jgi:hypothetical protein
VLRVRYSFWYNAFRTATRSQVRNLEGVFLMPEIVGFELGNSAGDIDCTIWKHDGVTEEIIKLIFEQDPELANHDDDELKRPTSAEYLIAKLLPKSGQRSS